MGENNNKPIGFTQQKIAYGEFPIGFTGYSGPYGRSLSIQKNSIWGVPIGNSVRPGPGRPVHLVEGAYGVLSRIPDRLRGGQSVKGG